MKAFDEVFEDVTKYGTKVKTDEYHECGKSIIIDQGQTDIAGYTDREEGLFSDVPAIVFGDHTRAIKYVDKPFFLGADGVKVLKCKCDNANYRYLYYALKSVRIPDTGYNRHFKWLKEALIPYPDYQIQKKVVAVLDKVQTIIEARKKQLRKLDDLIKARFVEMFGDPELNPKKWDKQPLSSVITAANNGMARRGNDKDGSIVMRLVELQDGYIDYSNPNRIILTDTEKRRYLLKDKDSILDLFVNSQRLCIARKAAEILVFIGSICLYCLCKKLAVEPRTVLEAVTDGALAVVNVHLDTVNEHGCFAELIDFALNEIRLDRHADLQLAEGDRTRHGDAPLARSEIAVAVKEESGFDGDYPVGQHDGDAECFGKMLSAAQTIKAVPNAHDDAAVGEASDIGL